MNKQEKLDKYNKDALKGIATDIKDIMDNGGHLQVIIHKTSDTNLTWYYSVYLWYQNKETGKTENSWLNWFIAESLGKKLTKDNYLVGKGVGTERSFEVAYDLGHIVAFHLQLDPYYSNGDLKDYGYLFTNRVARVC